MKNLLKISFLIAINLGIQQHLIAQIPVSITKWKGDAKGCYNIIHDDYGDWSVIGINNYADTMNYRRGLKITFGAITSSCESNTGMYSNAKNMIEAHGHEIINHSHNHTCAIGNSWCTTGKWAETATENFAQEIDYSTNSIKNNTGYTPKFYIYPYDLFNTASNNHLKSKGYIGSRTGGYNEANQANFSSDIEGFFRPAFIVDTDGGAISSTNLNSYVDYAINYGVWINRELHNIGNSGWGRVTETAYRTHLNYVKSKVDANDLWVGTISEILTYQKQKQKYTPIANYNNTNDNIEINFSSNNNFDLESYLGKLYFKSPVTIKIDLSLYPNTYTIYQNSQIINDFKKVGNSYYINAYPHEGPIVMVPNSCDLCLLADITNKTVNENAITSLSVNAQGTTTINFQWYKDNLLLAGQTNSNILFNTVKNTDAGTYKVVLSNVSGTLNSSEAILTVNSLTPFNNIIEIPGFIEAENYDNGGNGLSYNDSDVPNTGNALTYRNDEVDINTNNEGGYYITNIKKDEWFIYTIDVKQTNIYNFFIHHASISSTLNPGKFEIYLDGKVIIPETKFDLTTSAEVFNILKIEGINLNAGIHTLKFVSLSGNFNLNKITVSTDPLNIQNVNTLGNISIFPIPAQNYIEIHSDYDIKNATVEIYNITGKLAKSFENVENVIDISSLQNGIYTLKINNDKGIFITKFSKNE